MMDKIKRHLILGRKAMTHLDSMLKGRDITVPTKVHLVKAMIFPVVIHGCENWTIKKAKHIRSHHFMGNRWGNSGNTVRLLFFWSPKSLQMVTAAMKLKDAYSLVGKL